MGGRKVSKGGTCGRERRQGQRRECRGWFGHAWEAPDNQRGSQWDKKDLGYHTLRHVEFISTFVW